VLNTDDFTIVTGTTTQQSNAGALTGAVVSAQVFDPAALDPKDVVTVRSSTDTAIDGSYELFVKPGDYNLVAYQPGFAPVAVNFTALPGQVQTQDFALTASDMGTLSGNVAIAGITQPTFASLSFEQGVALPGEEIEVDSADVLSGQSYSTSLPVGDYQVVSSTCELPTQVANVTLASGAETLLDINF